MAHIELVRSKKGRIKDIWIQATGLDGTVYELDTYAAQSAFHRRRFDGTLLGNEILSVTDISQITTSRAKSIIRYRPRIDYLVPPGRRWGVSTLELLDTAQSVVQAFEKAGMYAPALKRPRFLKLKKYLRDRQRAKYAKNGMAAIDQGIAAAIEPDARKTRHITHQL
jgi:hypothetical protein